MRGDDGRGARHVAQQRDLAEALADHLGAPEAPALGDLDLAARDHVEAIAGLALADDRRARRERARCARAARELLEAHDRQRREHADAAQQLGTRLRHRASRPPSAHSARQRARTTSGSTTPTTSSAPRSPSVTTSAGASSDPIPVVSQYVPSTTPNARASTASDASRWTSVSPATSITA